MTVEEPIAGQLRQHQTSVSDWPYAALARELHHWVEILDDAYKLQLPSYPILEFSHLHRNAVGAYRRSRNEIGTKDNIIFNIRYLGRDPVDTLATLLHELLHLWQQYHGKPGSRNYHNREYRDKALACGLVVTPVGCHVGYTEAFMRVLSDHGYDPAAFQITTRHLPATPKQPTRMKKWSCRCTTIRCATDLQALCLRCAKPFLKA